MGKIVKKSTYKKILQACRKAKKITTNAWNVTIGANGKYRRLTPRCAVCAMGAVLLGTKPGPWYRHKDAADQLGIDEADVHDFIDGFDGVHSDHHDSAFYKAGQRLHRTLKREGILVDAA